MPEVLPAQIAKLALRRLALSKQEPTPENYSRAYAAEAGGNLPEPALPERAQGAVNRLVQLGVGDAAERQALVGLLANSKWDEAQRHAERLLASDGPAAQGEALAHTIDHLVRGLERGGRQWTLARKKDGLARVLGANKGDGARMVKRLRQLVSSWDSDSDAGLEAKKGQSEDDNGGTPSQFFNDDEALSTPEPKRQEEQIERISLDDMPNRWPDMAKELHETVQTALTPASGDAASARAQELMEALAAEHRQAQAGDTSPQRAASLSRITEQSRRLLVHRRYLMEQLGGLCQQLSGSLVELSEEESWVQGQTAVMNEALSQGLSAMAVRGVAERLAQTREQQSQLRQQRRDAREALKGLVQTLLAELTALGHHTDRFSNNLGRYAEGVAQADSLESLTGLVREMVEESRTVQGLVQATQGRLQSEHARTQELTERVNSLEGELRRISEEAHTDQLTQIANRRGLNVSFESERAKQAREGHGLAIALLDIDNFKKLNDSLGHAAGDEALRGLAAKTQAILRPGDHVARYGGEEFVLLLPDTSLDEARQVLGRLQRALSASLFMHDGKDVFVTFSAGVTLYRQSEALEAALERADEALYEAKRTGKNRTCVAG
jgi:diguanylate cyclase